MLHATFHLLDELEDDDDKDGEKEGGDGLIMSFQYVTGSDGNEILSLFFDSQ